MKKSFFNIVAICMAALVVAACGEDLKKSQSKFNSNLSSIKSECYSSIEEVVKDSRIKNSQKTKKVEALENKAGKKICRLCTSTAKRNKDNNLGLDALIAMSPYASYEQINPVFLGLSSEMRETSKGRVLERIINNIKTAEESPVFVDFEADQNPENPGFNMAKLSDYVGEKYLLACFWYFASSNAREAVPVVKNMLSRYKGQFNAVAVSCRDADMANSIKAAESNGIDFPIIYNALMVPKTSGVVKYIPEMILINPEGKVVETGIQPKELEATLRKYLVF